MTTHDAMRAVGLLAQGWRGPNLAPAALGKHSEEDSLMQCVELGFAACFVNLDGETMLPDEVLPRRYLYLLTERGRIEYEARR